MKMNVTIPAADPLPLPAPPWLLWGLLMLTFFLHLLAMNFILGGSIIAMFARAKRDGDAMRLSQWIGKVLPTAVAATVTFGVAPLLFLQVLYGRLFFSSAVLMAWWWLAVVPLVIVAYYGTYVIAYQKGALDRWVMPISVAIAAILAVVAFIYSNNMTLMLRPNRFLPLFLENASGVQLNLGDPTLIPRYLHMLLGAIAVAGLFVSIYGWFAARKDAAHGTWAMRHGAIWFSAATAGNLLAGLWWFGALPRAVMLRFVGGSTAATLWAIGGTAAGLGAVWMMIAAIRAHEPARFVKWGTVLTAVTLIAMVVSRDQVREGMLRLAQFEATTWIEPQWGVIALFGALLVAAIATTAWMARLVLAPKG
jgi:hypothetical protein